MRPRGYAGGHAATGHTGTGTDTDTDTDTEHHYAITDT